MSGFGDLNTGDFKAGGQAGRRAGGQAGMQMDLDSSSLFMLY